MRKIAITLLSFLILTSCSKKKENSVTPSRSFKGADKYGNINAEATTTVNSSDQTVGVKVVYTNDNGIQYSDSIKLIDNSGSIHSQVLSNRSKGGENNLTFNNMPLNKSYTCLMIRNGSASYPDTLINIKGN